MTTILYLHSSSDLYGSDRSLLRTIQGLDRARFEPIVCLPYEGPLAAVLREMGVTVHVFDLAVMRRKVFTPVGVVVFLWHLVSAFVRIRRIALRARVGIIHSNTSAVVVGGCISRLMQIPHLWHVREIVLSPTVVRKFIAWSTMHGGTVIIGVSTSVIDNLCRDQPRIRAKSRVIHNGIKTELFSDGDGRGVRRQLSIGKDQILVGMLGRVGTWKGQDLFLDVARKVRDAGEASAAFLAVGSAFGEETGKMDDFRRAVAEKSMTECFFVSEFRKDVKDILAALDVFVLPSILPDPFPTTVLEAMAAGKPVVANAHGGVVEMIEDGVSGFLVTPNDSAEMSRRILDFVRDGALRLRCGAAARERVRQRFHVTDYLHTINTLYRSVEPTD